MHENALLMIPDFNCIYQVQHSCGDHGGDGMRQDVPHQVHVQPAVPTRGTGQKHDAHEGTYCMESHILYLYFFWFCTSVLETTLIYNFFSSFVGGS